MADIDIDQEIDQRKIPDPLVNELEVEPEITEEDLQFSEFQKGKDFDLGQLPVEKSPAERQLSQQTDLSTTPIESQINRLRIGDRDPDLVDYEANREELRRKQPLDYFANDLRQTMSSFLGSTVKDKPIIGGMPYRVKGLSGEFEDDRPAILERFSEDQAITTITVDMLEGLKNIILSKEDSNESDKEEAIKALGAFTETVGQVPLAYLVAREAAINVATKDIPWLVKNVFVKLPVMATPVYGDINYLDMASNTVKYVANHGIDLLKYMGVVNWSNYKYDLEDIMFREHTFTNAKGEEVTMPLYQHIERLDKALGVTRTVEDIGKDLLLGMQVPEDQRNVLHHMIRFGVEIGLPLFMVPMGGTLRTISRGAQHLDNFNVARTIKKHTKDYKGTQKGLENLSQDIRDEVIKSSKIIKKGPLGTTIELESGIRHTIPPLNNFTTKQAAKELGTMRWLNMTVGAGVAGGVVHDYFINSPDLKQYAPVAYIASIAGAIKGAAGLSRAVTRVPGLLSPLGSDMLSVLGYSAVGLSRGIGSKASRGILHYSGDLMRMLRKEGSKADFLDSKWGMFLQAQSAGVSLSRSLKDVVRNEGAGLQKLINEEAMPTEAYIHLAKFYRAMSDEERQTLENSLESATRLARSLHEMAGANGLQEQTFMLDQVINLSIIRSQRQVLMNSIKFGKEGFLSKHSRWGDLMGKRLKAGKMLSHMDQYEKVVENQIGAMAKALKNIRKSEAVGTKGSAERVRMANFIDNYIDKALDESANFSEKLAGFKAKADDFTYDIEKDRFRTVLKMNQNGNGPFDPDFMPSLYRDNPVAFTQSQHRALDGQYINDAATASKEILDGALSAAWSRSNKLYDRINQNSKFADKYIPINNVVNKLTEEMITSSPTIMRKLSGLDTSRGKALEQFIVSTKMNNLNNLDYNQLLYRANEIQVLTKKFEDAGQLLNLRYKGNEFELEDINNLLSKVKEEGPLGAGDATLRDFLANLSSTDIKVAKSLSNMVPSVIPLKDLRSIMSNLGNKSSTKRPQDISVTNTFEPRKDMKTFNEAYDLDSNDELLQQVLKDQGLSTQDIKDYIRFKKKADENYKNEIGYVWKRKLGEDLTKDPRLGGPRLADEENLLHFFQYAKVRVSGEKTTYGVEAFNRAFPDKGTTEITKISESGDEVIEVVENSVLRERAKKMLLHQIALKTVYGKDKGLQFANTLTPDVLDNFIKAKIIPEDIGHNLKVAFENLQQGSVKDEVIKETKLRLGRQLKSLANLKEKGVQRSWLGGLSSKGDDFNQADFVEAIVYGVGKTGDVTEAAGRRLKAEMKDDVTELGRATEEAGKPITGRYSVESTQRAIDDLPLQENVRDENINIFINTVKSKNIKDPKEAAEAIKMLDDATDLVLNHGYNEAFQFSKFKATFGDPELGASLGTKNVGFEEASRLAAKEQSNSFTFHRLKMDVNPDKLAAFVDDAAETIEKLSKQKLEIANVSKDKALIAAATKDLKMVNQLKEINSMAAIIKGDSPTLGIAGQPADFVGSQIISRVYSWARGVVGMQYLATEAAYKSWHLAHANMMKDILFNPAAVDILHKIAVRKGKMTDVDFKTLSGLVFKAFFRGQGYSNAQEKKKGEQALVAAQKITTLERGIELAEKYLGFVIKDPYPKEKHKDPIFTTEGTIRGPKPKPAAPWTKSRPQPQNTRPNHY